MDRSYNQQNYYMGGSCQAMRTNYTQPPVALSWSGSLISPLSPSFSLISLLVVNSLLALIITLVLSLLGL